MVCCAIPAPAAWTWIAGLSWAKLAALPVCPFSIGACTQGISHPPLSGYYLQEPFPVLDFGVDRYAHHHAGHHMASEGEAFPETLPILADLDIYGAGCLCDGIFLRRPPARILGTDRGGGVVRNILPIPFSPAQISFA